jgi:hypothetical protein
VGAHALPAFIDGLSLHQSLGRPALNSSGGHPRRSHLNGGCGIKKIQLKKSQTFDYQQFISKQSALPDNRSNNDVSEHEWACDYRTSSGVAQAWRYSTGRMLYRLYIFGTKVNAKET